MIISHKYKFIFIHVPKTGGTSIKESLKKACKESFNCRLIDMDDVATYGIDSKYLNVWAHHLPVKEQHKMVSEDVWQSYFKFAFVRNPFDLLVSEFFYAKNFNINSTFAPGFLRRIKLAQSVNNFDEYLQKEYGDHNQLPLLGAVLDEIGGNLLDFIGRYENIEDDFRQVCKIIGVDVALMKINATRHDHYRVYYSKESRDLIQRLCAKDLAKYGYIF